MMYDDDKLVPYHCSVLTLAIIRMTALAFTRAGCAGIRAMITAIILPGLGYALSLFNFAIAATAIAISIRHRDSLPF
jgi:hypothetical protein